MFFCTQQPQNGPSRLGQRVASPVICSLIILAGCLLGGCHGPLITCRIDTAIEGNLVTTRSVDIAGITSNDRDAVPAKLEKYLRFPDKGRYQSWEANPGRLTFAGVFPKPEQVPVDFIKLTPGSDLWSQSKMTVACRDYVLFKVFDFRETIEDTVEREEAEEALDEAMGLVLESLITALESRFNQDYDLSRFNAWLRTTIPELTSRLYQCLWEIRRSDRGPGGSLGAEEAEWERRLRREISRYGLSLGPMGTKSERKLNEVKLWAFLDKKLQSLVIPRRRTVPPLNAQAFRSKEQQQLLLTHLQKSVVESFGSVGNFIKKVNPLIPVVMGSFFGMQVNLLQNVPAFQFFYRVRLPGTLIQTNGTRDLDGVLVWRFSQRMMLLTGYRMWARTLVVNDTAVRRIPLTNFPGSLAVLERFHLAVRGRDGKADPRLLALLAACVQVGSLKPLQDAALPGNQVGGVSAERARELLGVVGAFYRPGGMTLPPPVQGPLPSPPSVLTPPVVAPLSPPTPLPQAARAVEPELTPGPLPSRPSDLTEPEMGE